MNRNSSGEVAGDGFGISTNSYECGEVVGEVVGDGNCDSTISKNGGEVESREELREVRDEEFIYENSPDDHHGEVESGDIAEINEGGRDRKFEVGSGETIRGEVRGEVVGDGFCGASNSKDGGEVESREELREVCDEECIHANSPDHCHGEVVSGDVPETNEGGCDGKVEVGIRETIGGVLGDGIGCATNNPNYLREFECVKLSREDCADSTNFSNDNHGEVKVGEINENKKNLYDGEVAVDNSDFNGEVQNQQEVVEYIHNGNDSGQKSNSGEENQKSNEKKYFEKEFSILDCFFILGIPKNASLTEAMLNQAYRKAMQQAHPDKAKCDESSQEKAKERCQMIQHARDMLQKLFDGSSDEISSDNNDSEDYDWGLGGEHGDGWGPGFGEEDGYYSDMSENDVTEEMVVEAFEILGQFEN